MTQYDTNSQISRRGIMLVLSSPSGAGKTTISRRLLDMDDRLNLSISATTRKRRPGEMHGEHYYFIDTQEFNLMVNGGAFFEHAKVFDNYYGTPRAPVEESLKNGMDVLFDIDWQGTQQLAEKARDDLVSIFILPPSWNELERRLRGRAQDSAEEISRRMSKAESEMTHWAEYDYVIVNNDIEQSVQQVNAILTAERLRRRRQSGLASFVKGLQAGL